MRSNARSLVLIGVFSAVAPCATMTWPPGKEIAQRMMMRHVNAWQAACDQAVTVLRTNVDLSSFEQGWDAAAPKSGSRSESSGSSDSKRAPPPYHATMPLASHAGGDDNIAVKPCPCGTAKVPRTIVIESPKQSGGGRARQQQRQQQWCACECHRQSGVCTYWDDRRGFGFIEVDASTADDSQALEHYRRDAEGNVFVHYSDIKHMRGHRSLYVGETLEFQLARHEHSGKYKAMDVTSAPLIDCDDDLDAFLDELTGSSPRT